MNYILINTAGTSTEVIVKFNGKAHLFCEENGKMASESLLPSIENIMNRLNARLSDADYFACVTGPGSFTGIRIGIVTVKALCYALYKPAAGISYNRALSLLNGGKRITIVNGWSDNYYAALYDGDDEVVKPAAMTKSELYEFIKQNPDCLVICDPASFETFGGIKADFMSYLEKAGDECATKLIHATEIEPLYAMQSQAERDLEK